MINYSFYTHFNGTLAAKGVDGVAEYCEKMGLSSVEVLETAEPGRIHTIPDAHAAEDFRRRMAARGLSTACYSVGTTVYGNRGAVESLKRQAEIVSALECPYLHHTLFLDLQIPENAPPEDEILARCTEAAIEIAHYAKPLGVTCIYEDQGMYVNGIENFGKFYRTVKSAAGNVGVCGDVGNILFVDEDPVAFFSAFAEEIVHVHIKDYIRKHDMVSPGMYWYPTRGGAWLRDTMTGSGCIDFGSCIEVLKKAGYRGAYAMELCHPEPFDEGIRQTMQYLERFLHV